MMGITKMETYEFACEGCPTTGLFAAMDQGDSIDLARQSGWTVSADAHGIHCFCVRCKPPGENHD